MIKALAVLAFRGGELGVPLYCGWNSSGSSRPTLYTIYFGGISIFPQSLCQWNGSRYHRSDSSLRQLGETVSRDISVFIYASLPSQFWIFLYTKEFFWSDLQTRIPKMVRILSIIRTFCIVCLDCGHSIILGAVLVNSCTWNREFLCCRASTSSRGLCIDIFYK